VSHALDDDKLNFNAHLLERFGKFHRLVERHQKVLVAVNDEGGGIIGREMVNWRGFLPNFRRFILRLAEEVD
jgi:hypothetical protein